MRATLFAAVKTCQTHTNSLPAWPRWQPNAQIKFLRDEILDRTLAFKPRSTAEVNFHSSGTENAP